MLKILEERNVRMIWDEGCLNVWFSAHDVGEELGIANIRDTLRNIDRTEKRKFRNEDFSGVGVSYSRNFEESLNNYGEVFVSEEAVYNMSFRSNKPEAKLFTKQVTKVLKQIRTNGYFVSDEKTEEWLGIRQQTKEVRKQETDVIAKFIEYAKSQGSTNADKYYFHFTNLANKRCGLNPKERDKADQKTLLRLKSLETLIEMRLETLMGENTPYKVAYEDVKNLINHI